MWCGTYVSNRIRIRIRNLIVVQLEQLEPGWFLRVSRESSRPSARHGYVWDVSYPSLKSEVCTAHSNVEVQRRASVQVCKCGSKCDDEDEERGGSGSGSGSGLEKGDSGRWDV